MYPQLRCRSQSAGCAEAAHHFQSSFLTPHPRCPAPARIQTYNPAFLNAQLPRQGLTHFDNFHFRHQAQKIMNQYVQLFRQPFLF